MICNILTDKSLPNIRRELLLYIPVINSVFFLSARSFLVCLLIFSQQHFRTAWVRWQNVLIVLNSSVRRIHPCNLAEFVVASVRLFSTRSLYFNTNSDKIRFSSLEKLFVLFFRAAIFQVNRN